MNLHVGHIKGTSFSIIYTDHELVGIMEGDKYTSRENMNEKQKHMASQWHASSLVDRLEESGG